MPRRSRLHVPGGVYYVVLRSNPGRHLFSRTTDFADFERVLFNALTRCRAFVHAFCWQSDAVHFVAQITDITLGRFIQRLTSQYARHIHKQAGGSGHLFQQRYHAVLIDPDAYLLRLVRHLHLMPGENPVNSHDAYTGVTRVPWLTRRLVQRQLTKHGRRPDQAYQDLMVKPEDPRDALRFERGSRRDPRVLGEAGFLATLPSRPCERDPRISLDFIIDAVALKLGLERTAVLSRSRQRQLALARAMVTWMATEQGVATLAEVGRKLHRDPSTLFVAVERYRVLRPELFDPVVGMAMTEAPAPVPIQ